MEGRTYIWVAISREAGSDDGSDDGREQGGSSARTDVSCMAVVSRNRGVSRVILWMQIACPVRWERYTYPGGYRSSCTSAGTRLGGRSGSTAKTTTMLGARRILAEGRRSDSGVVEGRILAGREGLYDYKKIRPPGPSARDRNTCPSKETPKSAYLEGSELVPYGPTSRAPRPFPRACALPALLKS
jgi:hypothetical protein